MRAAHPVLATLFLALFASTASAQRLALPDSIAQMRPDSVASFHLRRGTFNSGEISAFKQYNKLGDWSFIVRDLHGRELLVADPPVLDTLDIASVSVIPGIEHGSSSHMLLLTLTREAAEKLAVATRLWMNRELVFFVNGVPLSAAVIRAVVSQGKLSVEIPFASKDVVENVARGLGIR
jgi:hypothetical protein